MDTIFFTPFFPLNKHYTVFYHSFRSGAISAFSLLAITRFFRYNMGQNKISKHWGITTCLNVFCACFR